MKFLRSIGSCLIVVASAAAFQSSSKSGNDKIRSFSSSLQMKTEKISVMVNGMPGPMAVEVAKACIDRGFNLLPMGFTGPNQPEHLTVTGANSFVDVELVAGPGVSDRAGKALSILKEMHPNLIIVDYTHPSAILNNLQCYVDNDCDFVMGTTGGDFEKMMEIFNKGKNKAVIAPNMAKQIVALQAALQEMATRFPKSFADYKLTVTESHQSSKADTSGTAKAIVSHLVTLSAADFKEEEIVKLRDRENQLAFKVPEASLGGHAFHTYKLHSPDDRVYAEGTADAVDFLYRKAIEEKDSLKRIYNMIDVLESGEMM